MQRRTFASPHINGSPSFLATYHQSDVGPLSCRVTFKPVSTPLQRGIRFFRYPIPAPPTASLTVRLPRGREYGVTTFHLFNTNGLDPACPPVADFFVRVPPIQKEAARHMPFWLKLISTFSLSDVTMFSSSSHMLVIPSSLAPLPQ